MEQLIEQCQLREAHDRHGVEAGRTVVEHGEFGGDQHHAVLLVPVHRGDHVGDRGDALVVDALLEHLERAGVGQPDRTVAQTLLGDAEVDGDALGQAGGVERHADVADPCAGRHAGDIGHGEQLGGGPVEARAARADPDADRDRSRGDTYEQILDHVVADDGAVAVDLQDQRLRTIVDGPVDRVVDGVDEDRIHEPADLQHVDAAHGDRSVCVGVGVVLGLDGRTEQCEPGHQREHADR